MTFVKSRRIAHLFLFTLLTSSLFGFSISQDSTGLPGDHFSLEGALNLFKESKSPEDFEQKLNSEDSQLNNLDLNEDGKTDYIRVVDNMEDDVHAIVLQVPVSETESQDIAVIEIEKTGEESAILQIIGDENIYGEQTIVEPFNEKASEGKGGPNADLNFTRVVVNVWFGWPCVRYVYRPGYRVWVSPFSWGYYPGWWRPWRPRPFRVYYPIHVRHRSTCRVVTTHRVVRAHRVYTPRRSSSRVVATRTTTVKRTRLAPGKGKVTTSKTTTKVAAKKTPKGTVVGKQKTTTKKVRGKNGTVKGKKTRTTTKAKGKRGAVGKRKTTTRKRGRKN